MLRSLTQFPFKLTLGSRVEDKSRPKSHPCAPLLSPQAVHAEHGELHAEAGRAGARRHGLRGPELLCQQHSHLCRSEAPSPRSGEGCQWVVGNCLAFLGCHISMAGVCSLRTRV